jgi:hypothetical protein
MNFGYNRWPFKIIQDDPNLTDNGIDPNAAGYAIMTPLVEKAIASLHVGGPGRHSSAGDHLPDDLVHST